MGRTRRLGAWVTGLVAASCLIGSVLAPGARAADEAQLLPGQTLSAVTADLDADGAREIIRLLTGPGQGFLVDVWDLEAGSWRSVGSAELGTRARNGEPPRPSDAAAALIVMRDGGRERVLAFTAAADPRRQVIDTCCLQAVEVTRDSSVVALESVGLPDNLTAHLLQALDVDGDGRDEVLFQSTILTAPGGEFQGFSMTVASRIGARLVSTFELATDDPFAGVIIGDSNGVAGDDIILGPGDEGSLERYAWVGDEVTHESAGLALGEDGYSGYPAGVADGALVLVDGAGVAVLAWPAGGEPAERARLPSQAYPNTWVVEGERDAILVVQEQGIDAGQPAVQIHTLGMDLLGELPAFAGSDRLGQLLSQASGRGFPWYPYIGQAPDGAFGPGGAFMTMGSLVRPGGRAGFEVEPIAPLIGVQPIGMAGPDASWMVLHSGAFGGQRLAYLAPAGDLPEGSARLTVTPVATLIGPAATASRPALALENAIETGGGDGERRFVASSDGFSARVDVPAGSVVVVANGPLVDTLDATGAPAVIEVLPRRNAPDDENVEFERWILILPPDGRAQLEHWTGEFVRVAPELTASAATDPFSLVATVRGRATSGTTVTVDGGPAELNEYGAFRAIVDAPLWPRDVMVVARDALGNETASRLQVVGFLDYRGLPLAPILGLLTVAGGAVLFLRTPRNRPATPIAWGDATLEEIEAEEL